MQSVPVSNVKKVKELIKKIFKERVGEPWCESMNLITGTVLENKQLLCDMSNLKMFDECTFYHSINVAALSMLMGIKLNLSKDKVCSLVITGLLHDIGKMFIDKSILNKPGRLLANEFEIIKKHPYLGYDYVKKNYKKVPSSIYMGILEHHEKFNGEGYPCSINRANICLFARIISLVDVYDAMLSKRPYKTAIQQNKVLEYIVESGKSIFDPELIAVFLKNSTAFQVVSG